MKRLFTLIIFTTVIIAGNAVAQSAKFAATYDTDVVMVNAFVDGNGGSACDPADCVPRLVSEFDLAKMHVPQSKEVLIGVSGVVNLITITQAKGKNGGGESTAIADGVVELDVRYAPEGTADICMNGTSAAPGPIIFASRRQELSVTVDLDVVGSIPDVCDADCIMDNLAIEGDVTVALGLDTTAAHHFNFVAVNLDSDWYDIVACYDLTALAEVMGEDIDSDTFANATAGIGPRMLTLQQVRATTDGIVDESTN
jgi:hypothetical protein